MTTTKTGVERFGLTEEQFNLIQHFEADYNAIDQFLRKAVGVDKSISFTHLLRQYSDKHPGWRDAELLRMIAEVRNTIIHGKVEPYQYVAVPTISTVQKLRACLDRLINRASVIPTFQRKVETVSITHSLAHVLKIIAKRDYSQFPVYEGSGFKGLLTENGITHWLANHVNTDLSLIEMSEVYVKEVLPLEHARKNYQFVARNMRVDDVSDLFAINGALEAVLITDKGKVTEVLLGISTRWDMMHIPGSSSASAVRSNL
jgi:predicted transcriptional regulator